MPGIVGLITKLPRGEAERQLLAMLGTLRHEPFYVTGMIVVRRVLGRVRWMGGSEGFVFRRHASKQ
jgi:hypothetical protein